MDGDTLPERHERARRAFRARRRELHLTQQQVAELAGIAIRTVQNFEKDRWPNIHTMWQMEKVVGWPKGEIERIADASGTGRARPTMEELIAEVRSLREAFAELEEQVRGQSGAG